MGFRQKKNGWGKDGEVRYKTLETFFPSQRKTNKKNKKGDTKN